MQFRKRTIYFCKIVRFYFIDSNACIRIYHYIILDYISFCFIFLIFNDQEIISYLL